MLLLITLTMAHSESAQYQDTETDAAKWNSAIIHFYYLHHLHQIINTEASVCK